MLTTTQYYYNGEVVTFTNFDAFFFRQLLGTKF